ncbi:MAG: MBL fold metallo-hydrolase [Candidatus Symbiobacter sp.]|nr:MBL fold metallo-hydrolase [Candidatus Symbiobacter sp.]
MKVTFWGVRGSIPCASDTHLKYGGNTSCLTVEKGDAMLILDAGTGIVELGKYIRAKNIKSASLLLSHAHLDHIMGLPFFSPVWNPDFKLDVFAGHLKLPRGIESVFNAVFGEPTFPVPIKAMRGITEYTDFVAGEDLSLNGFMVRTIALYHPNGATGYSIELDGKKICYITDVEHVISQPDQGIINFIKSADLFIYDTTYTDQEFPAKIGWGHSTWQEGMRLGQAADVKRYALFHHEPDRTDAIMEKLEAEVKSQWDRAFVAREKMIIEL